ncbi:MAG TPA: glycosyltransferase family 2 protein [Kofleriaceae bacterium]|jgi:cellulose synthase/poly-beta-1,6-N-acetylglucosamine synthase-like glycosyltransferase
MTGDVDWFPPSDLLRRVVGSEACEVRPFPADLYATVRKPGRELLRHFYTLLRESIPELPTVAGEVFVVVPARNEEKGIQHTLDDLLAVLTPSRFHVAVIVNATTDATEARVRAWLATHEDRVEHVADGRASASDGPPRLRVHLLDEPTPGKVLAMSGVDRVFLQRGAYPEWIAQVDADTRVSHGALDQLIQHATAHGEVAKTGAPQWRQRDGREAIAVIPDDPRGWRWQGLNGNFFVARTRVWLAGVRTVLECAPRSIGDDGILSTLFRLSGLRTGSATDPGALPYVTLAPSTTDEAIQQQVRWFATQIQLSRVFGREAIETIGLVSPAPPQPLILSNVSKEYFFKAAIELVQRAETTGSHAWIPGRTPQEPEEV